MKYRKPMTNDDWAKMERQNLEGIRQRLDKESEDLRGWAQLRRILEAQQWEEWPSGDILIRVRRTAMVGCKVPGEIPIKACDVTVAPYEYAAHKTRLIQEGDEVNE